MVDLELVRGPARFAAPGHEFLIAFHAYLVKTGRRTVAALLVPTAGTNRAQGREAIASSGMFIKLPGRQPLIALCAMLIAELVALTRGTALLGCGHVLAPVLPAIMEVAPVLAIPRLGTAGYCAPVFCGSPLRGVQVDALDGSVVMKLAHALGGPRHLWRSHGLGSGVAHGLAALNDASGDHRGFRFSSGQETRRP